MKILVRKRGMYMVTAIAGGLYHSLALKTDGTVWAWGNNVNGQLGDGTAVGRVTPVQVSSLTNVIAIAAGYRHSVAVKSDGTVWTWGEDIGNCFNDTETIYIPRQVIGLEHVVAISCGASHSVALKSDGTVWAWGWSRNGELGNGYTWSPFKPVQVSLLTNIIAIVCGTSHSIAVNSNGIAWAWGCNQLGELGDGTETDRLVPVQVSNINDIRAIAGGYHYSLAIKADNTVWGWGWNVKGQLGTSSVNNHSRQPDQVWINASDNVIAIACGDSHTLMLKKDGTVLTCGSNDHGQLGDGTKLNKRGEPEKMPNFDNVAALACGNSHTLMLKKDGTVWTCGSNNHGQLGDGTTTDRETPVKVLNL